MCFYKYICAVSVLLNIYRRLPDAQFYLRAALFHQFRQKFPQCMNRSWRCRPPREMKRNIRWRKRAVCGLWTSATLPFSVNTRAVSFVSQFYLRAALFHQFRQKFPQCMNMGNHHRIRLNTMGKQGMEGKQRDLCQPRRIYCALKRRRGQGADRETGSTGAISRGAGAFL